jgi:hypothetical protein
MVGRLEQDMASRDKQVSGSHARLAPGAHVAFARAPGPAACALPNTSCGRSLLHASLPAPP